MKWVRKGGNKTKLGRFFGLYMMKDTLVIHLLIIRHLGNNNVPDMFCAVFDEL